MPVAVNTAMIAVSRRWANVRLAHACSSLPSSSPVKTGTSLSVAHLACELLAVGISGSDGAAFESLGDPDLDDGLTRDS
jgi:hypothetical protein